MLTSAEVMDQLSELVDLLSDTQRAQLKKHYTLLRLAPRASIYMEGDMPEFLYCMIRGKVKIEKNGNGERTQIFRVLKPVEFFGYRAYFAGEKYVTSATTFETSVICCIPMMLIEEWMQTNMALCHFFIRHLSLDLGVADQRTVSLTQKHIRGRLAEALLFLKDNYGLEADGATLSIFLSREDLANLSNMTTSNAIRTLSAFCNEKIVAVDGRKITLLNENELIALSKRG